jgi:hypothetical protein
MESRKTNSCNFIWKLPGGDERNNLHGYHGADDRGNKVCVGVFIPTPEERAQIAAGGNIGVVIWGETVPPMGVIVDEGQEVEKEPVPTLASACMQKVGCEYHAECAEIGHCKFKG